MCCWKEDLSKNFYVLFSKRFLCQYPLINYPDFDKIGEIVEEKNNELQLQIQDLKAYPRTTGKFTLVNYPEAKIEQINFSTTIQQNQAVFENSLNEYLNCLICTNVVEEPQQCSNCDRLFCRGCIEEWISNSDKCPNCREQYEPYAKLNMIIRNALADSKYQCDLCPNQFTYEGRHRHF